jgi:hypothetical protein
VAPGAEDGVELGVVVGGEQHGVVAQTRRPAAQREQQHEAGEGRRRPPQRPARGCRRGVRHEVAVDVRGVRVGDDGVRRQRLPGRQPHARGRAAGQEHALDRRAGPDLGAGLGRAPLEGVAEAPQPAGDVPRAERLLDVRHGRERRRCPARVGAGVRGVPVEERALVGVPQVLRPEPAQAPPRRDRPHVADAAGQAGERPPAVQRGLEEGLAGQVPDRGGPAEERRPVVARAGAERGVPGGGDRGAGGVRQVELGAVGEPVVADRVDRPQLEDLVQRAARLEEEVPVHRRQREEARAGVEGEAVPLVPAELAAGDRRLLADGDLVPGGGEPRGHREPAGPGADDDDPCHAATALPVRSASGARAAGRAR